MRKMFALIICAAMLATALAACDFDWRDRVLAIGIVTEMHHPGFDQVRQGFVTAIGAAGIPAELDFQQTFRDDETQGDEEAMARVAQRFAGNEVDLVFSLGADMARVMSEAAEGIPVVAVDLTEEPGLVYSDEELIAQRVALIAELVPGALTIGVLYSPVEDPGEDYICQAEIAVAAMEEAGFAVEAVHVSAIVQVEEIATELAARVEAFFLPTDPILYDSREIMAQVSLATGVPVFSPNESIVRYAGVATYSVLSYTELGRQAGILAARVLMREGRLDMVILDDDDEAADIPAAPVHYARRYNYYVVNGFMAAMLGIDIPARLDEYVIFGDLPLMDASAFEDAELSIPALYARFLEEEETTAAATTTAVTTTDTTTAETTAETTTETLAATEVDATVTEVADATATTTTAAETTTQAATTTAATTRATTIVTQPPTGTAMVAGRDYFVELQLRIPGAPLVETLSTAQFLGERFNIIIETTNPARYVRMMEVRLPDGWELTLNSLQEGGTWRRGTETQAAAARWGNSVMTIQAPVTHTEGNIVVRLWS